MGKWYFKSSSPSRPPKSSNIQEIRSFGPGLPPSSPPPPSSAHDFSHMKEFNLRQVKAEQDRGAKKEPGSAGERDSYLAGTGSSGPGPWFPPAPPCAAPTRDPGFQADSSGPPHPRAQDEGPQLQADAARGPLGDSPPPDALHHQWRCVRPAPGKVGGRGCRPAGLGPPDSGRGLAGRGDRARGYGGFPPLTFRAGTTSLCARPVLQEREPRLMSGLVFLRARGLPEDDGDFFFLSTRRKNEAETMWEANEGRGAGRRELDPSRESVSGVREEEEAGSAGGCSRASVGAAAPRRWWPSRCGAAAPTHRPLRARARPTSQYRAQPLARPGVTRKEA